jgi:hypothetical protein
MRHISEKKGIPKIKTHILCSINFFAEGRTVHEIMLKNMFGPNRPQMTKNIAAHQNCMLDK